MIKAILGGSFDFNDAFAAIVPAHSRGIDTGWSEKRAAARLFDFAALAKAAAAHETLVHLLALGDGETTGPNRNGDYFSKAANVQYHPTFLKGHYFHNHVNKDPAKSFGRIVAAAHNDDMGRVELVIAIDEKKAADDLTELEKKGEFPVSMSCRVPFDVCMICGNKAATRNDYCKHASLMMGQIMADGKQACVDNTHPDFFDISKVHRGADRVAWTFQQLEKAAADNRIVGGAELAELLEIAETYVPVIKSAYVSSKAATLRGLLAAANCDQHHSLCNALRADAATDEDIATLKSASDLDGIFATLHRYGVCLPLPTFMSLTGLNKSASDIAGIRQSLCQIFKRGSEDPELCNRLCRNGSYDGRTGVVTTKMGTVVNRWRPQFGLRLEDAYDRLVDTTIRKGHEDLVIAKSASSAGPEADMIAEEYAAYLLSFADADRRSNVGCDMLAQNLTALRAFV